MSGNSSSTPFGSVRRTTTGGRRRADRRRLGLRERARVRDPRRLGSAGEEPPEAEEQRDADQRRPEPARASRGGGTTPRGRSRSRSTVPTPPIAVPSSAGSMPRIASRCAARRPKRPDAPRPSAPYLVAEHAEQQRRGELDQRRSRPALQPRVTCDRRRDVLAPRAEQQRHERAGEVRGRRAALAEEARRIARARFRRSTGPSRVRTADGRSPRRRSCRRALTGARGTSRRAPSSRRSRSRRARCSRETSGRGSRGCSARRGSAMTWSLLRRSHRAPEPGEGSRAAMPSARRIAGGRRTDWGRELGHRTSSTRRGGRSGSRSAP